MDEGLESRLGERLAESIPATFGVRIRRVEDRFEIGTESKRLLTIESSNDEWVVRGPDGHAHRETLDEAMDLSLRLLQGNARFATEYRGDVLAATWIEIWDGQAFGVHDQACFLSPFDAEEWALWPNERWRVVRKKYALATSEGQQSFERDSEAPSLDRSSMFGWLETALGPPVEGMRWTVGGQSRFVFQAPKGWRRRPSEEEDQQHNLIDFPSPMPGLVFRTRTYFRNAEEPHERPTAQAIPPKSVEYALGESGGEWTTHSWTLLFSDGEGEMMGVLELFYIESRRIEAETIRRRIDAAAWVARFVPHEWDMGADGP